MSKLGGPGVPVRCSTTPTVTAKKIKRAVTDTEREIRYDPSEQARRLATC